MSPHYSLLLLLVITSFSLFILTLNYLPVYKNGLLIFFLVCLAIQQGGSFFSLFFLLYLCSYYSIYSYIHSLIESEELMNYHRFLKFTINFVI